MGRFKIYVHILFVVMVFGGLVSCGDEDKIEEPEDQNGENNDLAWELADLDSVVVDLSRSGGPDVTYKRGTAAPGMGGFFDSEKMRDYLDYQSSIEMNIFNGIRNLFKDPETDEFYYEDGDYKNQQIDKFTDIRKYAHEKGFELISQVGGTPRNSNYEFDTTYRKTSDPTFYEPHTDFAPIPAEGESMQEFQRNFAEWAINAGEAVGGDFHSIWIGTQEIAHTIGFKDGIKNAETKKLNIRRWVDYWKPINDELRAARAETGGIQLNWSNKNIYNYAVDYMIDKDLHVDYLTYQFYQWGDNRALDAAIVALDRYNEVYPGTKIIIDRGHWGKRLPDGVDACSSQSTIWYLNGELGAMNYADKIYAHTLDRQVNGMDNDKNTVLWKTRAWINTTGSKRFSLSGLPSGLEGFAIGDSGKMQIALWNESDQEYDFRIDLKNHDFPLITKREVFKASGNDFDQLRDVEWFHDHGAIGPLNIKPDEILLITLNPVN